MRRVILLSIAMLSFTDLFARQPDDFPSRKAEIEKWTETVYFVDEFLKMADTLQLSVEELCDFPLIFPVKKPIISSGFGMRFHPVHKVWKLHSGIDIAKAEGTPVYATGNGTVTRKGYAPGYGVFIEVEHSGGFRSFYAHLSNVTVNRGDSVGIARKIACVGNTGVSTGCHLHYEVRKGKYFLDPEEWCYCLSMMIMKN